MLPTLWLDSRLGHVLADVSLHNFPAISTINWVITLTEVTVTFDKKRYLYVDKCIQYHFCNFLALKCIITPQFAANCCFFLYVQKNQPICWLSLSQHDMSCHMACTDERIWQHVRPTFPTCSHVCILVKTCNFDSFWGVRGRDEMEQTWSKAY